MACGGIMARGEYLDPVGSPAKTEERTPYGDWCRASGIEVKLINANLEHSRLLAEP